MKAATCEECDELGGWHAEGCSRALSREDRELLREQPDTTLARPGPAREQVPGPRLQAIAVFLQGYYHWVTTTEGRFAQYYARHERRLT